MYQPTTDWPGSNLPFWKPTKGRFREKSTNAGNGSKTFWLFSMKRVNINRKLLNIEMGIKLYRTQCTLKKLRPFYAHPDKMRFSAVDKKCSRISFCRMMFKFLNCYFVCYCYYLMTFLVLIVNWNHVSDRV